VKKILVLSTIFILMILIVTPSFAQRAFPITNTQPSNIFVKSFFIQQVQQHNSGWKVTYATSSGQLAITWIPTAWMSDTDGKGEIIYTQSRSTPYMQVYWTDGEFSFVRLFLNPNKRDISWGPLLEDPSLTEKFNIDSIQLIY
jgi:hypothetical protein